MGFFVALKAGYKLVRQMRPSARTSHPMIEARVVVEITASGIRNNNVTVKPTTTPVATLASTMRRAWVKIVFRMVFDFAPKALIMPRSRC